MDFLSVLLVFSFGNAKSPPLHKAKTDFFYKLEAA